MDAKSSCECLEEGDADLELSSLSTHSSSGAVVTSGTGVSSTSWNEEGLERGTKSGDVGLFPSDVRRFAKEGLSFRELFLPAALSPHPSTKCLPAKVSVNIP